MKTTDAICEPFRFKQFMVYHGRSSMKVGIDGVLVGAWGCAEGKLGIDAGCGCGIIGLMAAQKNPRARLFSVDIHRESVEEATLNFRISPWAGRLEALLVNFNDFSKEWKNRERFDFIISNPPFFNSGISTPSTAREKARHDSSFSPSSLIRGAESLLKPGGTLSLILPAERIRELVTCESMVPERICFVADKPGAMPKRLLALLRKGATASLQEECLYIRNEDGEYSAAYRQLTSPFYLKF